MNAYSPCIILDHSWIKPTVLEQAFQWLRVQRRHYSIHDVTWTLSLHWPRVKPNLMESWSKGLHRFSPMKRHRLPTGSVAVFEAEDSLLLKALQLALGPRVIPALSHRIYHLQGRGGIKAAVRDISAVASNFKYVFKSDIKSFYDSLDHALLLKACRSFDIPYPAQQLIKQSLPRVEEIGSDYRCIDVGITRGSALSPLLGAIVLHTLDKAMESLPNTYYARYMDDWVVLCHTRTQLRKIVKLTHAIMKQLKLSLHPDKTYIGKIEKGFAFLGYQLSNNSLTIHPDTLQKHRAQLQQRYAQGAKSNALADYAHRFTRWCRAGVRGAPLWDDDKMQAAQTASLDWITAKFSPYQWAVKNLDSSDALRHARDHANPYALITSSYNNQLERLICQMQPSPRVNLDLKQLP